MSIGGNYSGIYNNMKHALYDTLVSCFNNSEVRMDVYKVPFQNIPTFPAISLETIGRVKEPKAMGASVYHIDYYVWVYTSILDSIEAEEQCLELTRITEEFLLANKTLGGKCSSLSIDEELQFGVIEQGENNFLQGARIPVKITTKLVADRTPCEDTTTGGDCGCG